jgi:hypothetical protein
MTRPRPGIGSELLPVVMILLCLAGAWSLVVTMHHRGAAARAVRSAPAPVSRVAAPTAVVALPPPSEPPTVVPKPPAPPPVDPTNQALAGLMIAQTEQIVEAQIADRKAQALESARLAAVAEKERARRREALVRAQVDRLAEQAKRLESELGEVALERDVLAQERDAAKAALAKARARSSYAVLPHKGPNGTWRRPIIIECNNGQATLQPNGPSFSLLDLSLILGPRSSPIVAAVARELVRSQAVATPDGAPVVPYIFFVIRPDGIKPYYQARAQLEPLGVSFGYELVDQNLEIDYPDLDNLDEWDSPVTPRPSRPGTNPSLANTPPDRPWPGAPSRGAGGRGSGDPADTFVWPARPGLEGSGSGGGSPGSSGSGGGYGNGTANGDTPGAPGLPRGGRTGVETQGGALAGGPYTPARNGLGRGGSGVDPLPLGTPILDPDNPYDNVGAGSSIPGGQRSGGPPAFGLTSGSPGSGALNRSSDGNGGSLQPPAGGSRLIPVSPGGLPGFEDPNPTARGSNRTPNDSGAGSWRAVDPNQKPSPGGGAGTRPGGNSAGRQDLARLTPGGGNDTRDPAASPPYGGAGSANPNAASTPAQPGSAGGNVDPNQGTHLVLPGGGSGEPQPATPAQGGVAGRSINPYPGATPAQSGGADADPDQTQLPPQSLPQGPPPAPSAVGSGDTNPSTMPSQSFGGNYNPNQGSSPPLSQLAQLAGMTGDPGVSGPPPTSKLQSSTPFGIPFPLPSQNSQGSSSGDDSDSGQKSSQDGMHVPGSRSRPDKKPLKIDVPFELVVACGPEGVVIHPGGYRLSAKALKGTDGLLLRDLKRIVQTRRQVDPTIHPIPSIRFLVESGGGETYRDARRQTMLSGLDWPVAIQVSDSDILDNITPREPF